MRPVSTLFAFLPLMLPSLQDPAGEALLEHVDALRAEIENLRRGEEAAAVTPPRVRLAGWEEHRRLAESSPYADYTWRFLGPTHISGRVTDVAAATPRGRTYRLYVASASGGVWRSDNDGASWRPIFEHAPTASIGALGLDPADPDVLWVGTGEANIFRSSMAGIGIFVTRDGGETWERKGLERTHTIARIVIDPRDSSRIYVAASGHEWTDNPERGVYRSKDGGESWERVLFVDEGTGAIDLILDPSDPDRLYAATWQRRRLRWNDPRNSEESQGSGIWRSNDGGDSWVAITDGLPPARERGRIGIDLCDSQPATLYAFIDHYGKASVEGTDSYGRKMRGGIYGATVYRSDDHGDHWRRVSEDSAYTRHMSATYGWVFGQIRVDPVDPETVYVMGLALNVSHDGGQTFSALRGMHGDHHALWIDPENPDYLLNGNDGGVAISRDGGEVWQTSRETLPVVQFYNLALDKAEPAHIYGSVQDHGSVTRELDLSRGVAGLSPGGWKDAPGGEASYHAVDPTDPSTLYAEGFYGQIFRQDLSDGVRTPLTPRAGEGEPELRGQWLAPFLLSPHNPRILYHGMNRLFRSWNRGEKLQPISPDLSHADPRKLGDIPYQTITALSESPLRFGRIYAGTDDGRLHRGELGGSWVDISAGLIPGRWISRVVASRWNEDVVWAAQNGKRHDDLRAYLWRSVDAGTTWLDRSEGLPDAPVNALLEDPFRDGLLYVGTDLGVYVTTDGGDHWQVLGNLPTVYVHDLGLHAPSGALFAATHGRGMWAVDVRAIEGREPLVQSDSEQAHEPTGEDDD